MSAWRRTNRGFGPGFAGKSACRRIKIGKSLRGGGPIEANVCKIRCIWGYFGGIWAGLRSMEGVRGRNLAIYIQSDIMML